MYAVYNIFPVGEMFLTMPGLRKGLEKSKAPGLKQSGITHINEQITVYRIGEDGFRKIPSIQSGLTFRVI